MVEYGTVKGKERERGRYSMDRGNHSRGEVEKEAR